MEQRVRVSQASLSSLQVPFSPSLNMIWQVSNMSAHESQETNYDLVEEEKGNKRPLQYLNSCPKRLPAAPAGHPHLIDSATFDETTDQITDSIATLLFKWKPEALDSFFDIKFTRKFEF